MSKQEALEMVQAGMSAKNIADELGVSSSTVYRWLQEVGASPPAPNVGGLPDEDITELLERYSTTDEPVISLIRHYGITYHQLYALIAQHQVEPRAVKAMEAKNLILDQAVRMYEAGHKLKSIRAETGIHASALYTELSKRGIGLRR